MKINTPKRTRAQLRKREADMLSELSLYHGYCFDVKLPKNQQSTMMFQRSGAKRTLSMAVVAKIIVPISSKLGTQIVAWRAKAEKRKAGRS